MASSCPAETARSVRTNATKIFAINFVACSIVALLLWLFVPVLGQHGLVAVFVFTQMIGNVTCALAVLGGRLLGLFGYRSLKLQFAVWPLIMLAGYCIGSAAAWAILDLPGSPFDFARRQEQLAASLATAIVVGGISTWYFATREEMANLKLAAAEQTRNAEAARRQAGEAQLAMLRAQVEPHMLFNTLANLRALVGQDPDAAREMLDRLVEFLRATLASSRVVHTSLRAEFELLNNYLALMRIRLGARLEYSLELPPTLSNQRVPALLLQPLVENAIRHGIEPSTTGGRITVEAHRRDRLLVLEVCDTGIGYAQSVDADPVASNSVDGFGLSNLKERLQSVYAGRARVEIQSPRPGLGGDRGTGVGTAVKLFLPFEEPDPGDAQPAPQRTPAALES